MLSLAPQYLDTPEAQRGPLCSYRKQHHMTNSIGPPSGLAFDACVHSGRLVSKTKSTFVIYLKHTQMGLGKGLVDLVKR